MEAEKQKMNVLGLVGLILGIIAAVIAWIPCLGVYAFFPGVVGLILSAIGLRHVKKGIAIAGLICSVVGTGIASYQWYVLNKAGEQLNKELQKIEQDAKSMETNTNTDVLEGMDGSSNEVVE